MSMRESLMMQGVRAAGMRKTIKALSYFVTAGITCEEDGKWPTAERYSQVWKQSDRSTFRDRAAFAAAYPDRDAAELWQQVREHVDGKMQRDRLVVVVGGLVL